MVRRGGGRKMRMERRRGGVEDENGEEVLKMRMGRREGGVENENG